MRVAGSEGFEGLEAEPTARPRRTSIAGPALASEVVQKRWFAAP